MDEGKDEENNNEINQPSWWGSWPTWLQAAKEKSNTALEFMKRDLTEFSHVVQNDAVAAVSSTAAMLKEKLTVNAAESVADRARQSISSVFGTISDVFAPQRELEDEELMVIRDSEAVALDWWQSKLYIIRKDPKTYCHEPEGPPEIYENWLESFHSDDHEEEMTEIMMSCSEVRVLYDKLVPDAVSHLEFWQRYFYRVHLLRKAEAKRADLMRRAEEISIDDVQWDKEVLNATDGPSLQIETHLEENITAPSEKIAALRNAGPHFESNLKLSKTVPRCDNVKEIDQAILDDKVDSKSAVEIPAENLELVRLQDPPAAKIVGDTKADVISDALETKAEASVTAENSEGSRSSPVESLGKESSTGDDWEKDFDLELTESDLLKSDKIQSQQLDPLKQDEDDWENWK